MASNIQDLRGYDHQFVEKYSDGLICLICLCVARDPHQLSCCGKLLCRACLEEYKKGSSNCPQCGVQIHCFADKKSDRDIRSLKARCDNSSNGCGWIGELRSLDKHLADCKFTLLPCPNKCSTNDMVVQVLRKDLEKHTTTECPRRQYECLHCHEAGEYQERTMKHLEECPMVEVACPNCGCNTLLIRRDLTNHHQECPFEKVPCKYSTIGCEEEVKRKDLEEHERDGQYHLQLAVDTVHQLQSKVRNMQAQSREMPVPYKFTCFNQQKTSCDIIYSPAFYTGPKGYKMCIGMYANGCGDSKDTHVSVYACLMKGENDDYLPWPFTGTVTVELLNQLEDKNHYSMTMKFPSDNGSSQRVVDENKWGIGWGWTKYISHSDLGHNAAKNCQYLKDDRLHFKISVGAESSSTPWLI